MAYPSDLTRTKNWSTEILTDTDLEGQLDLIISWIDAAMDETSGHKHDATGNEGPKLVLTAAAAVSGVLPVANGGTGVSTAATLGDLFYPVGIVITLGVSTAPNTLFGFGTWTAITGRVIVGIDAGTFDLLDEELGAESVDASHDHGGETSGAEAGGTGALTFNQAAVEHVHDITSDGSATQSTLQPSITKYVWQRTA